MEEPVLTADFKDFLKLLNAHEVQYLLIGGYAVAYYGYPRATDDLDIWVPLDEATAERLTAVLKEFGFNTSEVTPSLFLRQRTIVRMGMPPFRIEISNFIHGVEFHGCFQRKMEVRIDGVSVKLISLDDLKANKRAAARPKDLDDLENLP